MQTTIDQIDADHLLMFASDYPHQHTSDPLETFLPRLPDTLAGKIRGENAREGYRLA